MKSNEHNFINIYTDADGREYENYEAYQQRTNDTKAETKLATDVEFKRRFVPKKAKR